ncbi:MAG: RIP metalloprotease RseP [Bacteroidales bacterium]|nr:RIP metalloprotease RseP [Bacteroidales bacterium]
MKILIQASQFLLSLSILVFLHELGHFVFARIFKVRVEKFYIFFNPWFSLFKKKVGDTEYGIGWLPLGGYVKISGMIDESMDKEQMKKPPQPWEFRSKPGWQRLFIMVGGVLVNFLLALFLYATSLYIWGEQYLPNQNARYGIMCDTLALSMGLQNGDKIVSLDGHEVERFHQVVHDIIINKTQVIQVERDGRLVDVTVPDEIIAPLIKSTGFIETRIPFIAGDFPKESGARDAGIRKEDQMIGVNDTSLMFFDEYQAILAKYKNQPVDIHVVRGEEKLTFPVNVSEEGKVGIYPVVNYSRFFEMEKIEYTFLSSIPAGISKGISNMVSYLKQLKLLFRPKTKAYESLGGFIKIGSFFPDEWDWQRFWNLTALLSIILAIMNILPIPALDGGHVMFLLYEIVSGRKPGDKFLEYAQITGMILLLALLLYANGNDVIQLFRK